MLLKKTLIMMILFSMTSAALAAEHTVKLLTTGSNGQTMVMEPGFIKISKGDTIKFVPSDPSHNAESMITPSGASPFTTPMGKETTVAFNTHGVYLYKCSPHLALGMIGVVQVDDAVNITELKAGVEKIKATVFMNKQRFDEYLSQVK
ncbi:MAG: pseudoazurin [Litorilituus sp.]|jgi:pseudoazurin|nr:pseudoazurin [Litorilituus sp.]